MKGLSCQEPQCSPCGGPEAGRPGAHPQPLSLQPWGPCTFLAEIGGRSFPGRQAACHQLGPEGTGPPLWDPWTFPATSGPQPAWRAVLLASLPPDTWPRSQGAVVCESTSSGSGPETSLPSLSSRVGPVQAQSTGASRPGRDREGEGGGPRLWGHPSSPQVLARICSLTVSHFGFPAPTRAWLEIPSVVLGIFPAPRSPRDWGGAWAAQRSGLGPQTPRAPLGSSASVLVPVAAGPWSPGSSLGSSCPIPVSSPGHPMPIPTP